MGRIFVNLSTRTKPRPGDAGARDDALGRLAQLTGADLKIEHVPIGSLVPYARNPRTHTDAQIAQIAGSIRSFGFTSPLRIDGENGTTAGHGRLAAASEL